MLALALVNEARPAPTLSDVLLDATPYVAWIAAHNYYLWLGAYFPLAAWLWRRDRAAFVHFLYVGAFISLLRGVCINLTALGPVDPPDLNAGLSFQAGLQAWLSLVNPIPALGGAANVHLTKDLFFSGHTATTFLVYLYCRGRGAMASVALVAHLFVVATVFLSRLHYSIDVVGAWCITWAVYHQATTRWPPQETFSRRR